MSMLNIRNSVTNLLSFVPVETIIPCMLQGIIDFTGTETQFFRIWAKSLKSCLPLLEMLVLDMCILSQSL